mmetsp:Transcript_23162/g.53595  ORF Transcript_23162/g.53595 Transcript_23162/m.53595 type:complete len:218 (-) Transcript_23162:323-976(-)
MRSKGRFHHFVAEILLVTVLVLLSRLHIHAGRGRSQDFLAVPAPLCQLRPTLPGQRRRLRLGRQLRRLAVRRWSHPGLRPRRGHCRCSCIDLLNLCLLDFIVFLLLFFLLLLKLILLLHLRIGGAWRRQDVSWIGCSIRLLGLLTFVDLILVTLFGAARLAGLDRLEARLSLAVGLTVQEEAAVAAKEHGVDLGKELPVEHLLCRRGLPRAFSRPPP